MLKVINIPPLFLGEEEDFLYLSDETKEIKRLLLEGKAVAPILPPTGRGDFFADIPPGRDSGREFAFTPYAVMNPEELSQRDFINIYRRIKNLPWLIASTKRMKIREMKEGDIDEIYGLYKGFVNPISGTDRGYMDPPDPDPFIERARIRAYIKNVYGFYEYGIWILEDIKTGNIVGRAGVELKDDKPCLGYMIKPSLRRQGYAYEACRAIIEYCFNELKLEALYIMIHRDNTPSLKLAEKLGFSGDHQEDEGGIITMKL